MSADSVMQEQRSGPPGFLGLLTSSYGMAGLISLWTLVYFAITTQFDGAKVSSLELNEWGDWVAGWAATLAFFFLVIDIRLQRWELQGSVEQLRRAANIAERRERYEMIQRRREISPVLEFHEQSTDVHSNPVGDDETMLVVLCYKNAASDVRIGIFDANSMSAVCRFAKNEISPNPIAFLRLKTTVDGKARRSIEIIIEFVLQDLTRAVDVYQVSLRSPTRPKVDGPSSSRLRPWNVFDPSDISWDMSQVDT